jgi:hypothetical protein
MPLQHPATISNLSEKLTIPNFAAEAITHRGNNQNKV